MVRPAGLSAHGLKLSLESDTNLVVPYHLRTAQDDYFVADWAQVECLGICMLDLEWFLSRWTPLPHTCDLI